jgi:hypothetical protein
VTFVHEDPEFPDLLGIVSARRGLAVGLVEKDYWVTHTLWALNQSGFGIWFKGGTSLSKGFGLIERFSEDLDLKIESGREHLPDPGNWRSEGTRAIQQRRAYFDALASAIRVPGASVTKEAVNADWAQRNANFRVEYPGLHLAQLPPPMRPYVLLEVGNARVTPSVARGMSSFVHDHLAEIGQLGAFTDSRPHGVRCAHPLVTLLEKIDALQRRALREDAEPATFVRHFEDAARIIVHASELPSLDGYENARALALEMHAQRQIARVPAADDDAFRVVESPRWGAIRRAHAAIANMFWGPRIEIDSACESIRSWIAASIE